MQNKRDSFNKGWIHLRAASIMMAVVTLIFTPMIITGETGGNPSSYPVTTIASPNRNKPADNPGAGEESLDEVYEATKDLHETGIAQDVNIFNWRLDVEGDKVGKPLSLTYRERCVHRGILN